MTVLASGVMLGLAFNPVFATVGAAAAAALSGYPAAPRSRLPLSAAAVLAAWLLGDGLRVMARLQDGMRAQVAAYPALALWALVGLAAGYALPALLGAYVGRRVHFGTGWLAAGSVAASAAFAASLIVAGVQGT